MLSFEDFPAHAQLMLLAARTRLRGEERAAIERVASGRLRWEKFLELVEHHRVSPLVFEALNQVQPDGLPAGVLETLRKRATANAFATLRSVREVRRIAEGFAAAGAGVSVLKGVPLSQMIYGSPNARHVGDIDLLLEGEAGVAEAIKLLCGVGYERINPGSRLTPRRLASYARFWKDATFRNAESGFELDLHWRLFNNRYHAANRLLADAQYVTATVLGVEMRVFSLRDQFLYAAAHGVSDAWTYMKSLADVAACLRLLTAEQLEEALARAHALGLLSQVSAAVHLANDWMGAQTGSARLLARDEATAVTIREHTEGMLLKQDFRPARDYPSPAQWLRLELALVPGMRSVMEVAKRFVWRPRVWAALDLPDSMFWMYPVLGVLTFPRVHVPGGDQVSATE